MPDDDDLLELLDLAPAPVQGPQEGSVFHTSHEPVPVNTNDDGPKCSARHSYNRFISGWDLLAGLSDNPPPEQYSEASPGLAETWEASGDPMIRMCIIVHPCSSCCGLGFVNTLFIFRRPTLTPVPPRLIIRLL